MKVTLNMQGGIAGMGQQSKMVESSRLSQPESEMLEHLVAAAKSASSVEAAPRHARDSMTFSITIDEADGETTTLEQSDVAMSPSFAELLDWLERNTEEI
ncbi:MAG: hypothetical protein KDA84_14915 [Planctomycetaceae bacterium]|nr:hypothetical protein [Planctomycetaceae bacterium]